jgi:hypothetical protein
MFEQMVCGTSERHRDLFESRRQQPWEPMRATRILEASARRTESNMCRG